MNHLLNYELYEYNKNMGSVLYHFMDDASLAHTIKTGGIRARNNDLQDIFPGNYAISLTRKYNFQWSHIRFNFNTKSLAENFKLVPVHFHNNAYGGFDFRDLAHPKYAEYDQDFSDKDFNNQFETRLILKRSHTLPLKKSLLSIDICTSENTADKLDYHDDFTPQMQADEAAAAFNVPVNVVDSFKPCRFDS